MKTKIHFVIDWYNPSSLATSVRFQPLIHELTESGKYDIYIYTDKISAGEKNVLCNLLRSPSNLHSQARRLIQEIILGIELFVKLIYIRTNLVVISSPPFVTAWFAAMACRISGKKYFFDVRDIYPEVYAKAGAIKRDGRIFQFLEKCEASIYKHAIKVFTVTPKLRDQINDKSGKSNCELLRNGYSDKLFKVNPVKYEAFTVVFHGNLGRFQNPALLLKVAAIVEKRAPDIQFIVIGDGPQQGLLANHKLGNLRYLGRLENARVAEIIAQCHLGVSFRSDDEISIHSFPVKVYEYIGVGIPCLVTPYSEGGNLVDSYGFGKQFYNSEIEEIVSEVVKLKSDESYYSGFQDRILQKRSYFSREGLAKDFSACLTEALS